MASLSPLSLWPPLSLPTLLLPPARRSGLTARRRRRDGSSNSPLRCALRHLAFSPPPPLPPHSLVPNRWLSSPLTTTTRTTTTTTTQMSIEDTPLGSTGAGRALLDGLDVRVVPADSDAHPLAVYGLATSCPYQGDTRDHDHDHDRHARRRRRHPILLLHGRTWSSVPVYHLLGGSSNNDNNNDSSSHGNNKRNRKIDSRSLMEALYDTGVLEPYAMDFRGFGGTPPDHTGCVLPDICVSDVETVLKYISSRHEMNTNDDDDDDDGNAHDTTVITNATPALLGWSQGALVSQLVAQKSPHLLSKLVLYGSIYDPDVTYPRTPLYGRNGSWTKSDAASFATNADSTNVIANTYEAAVEDFTIEGSIPPEPARVFAEAALLTDPIKANWASLHQFNNCDPGRVGIPTLVIAGDQDPYAPLRVQAELFKSLGRGADRTWSILSNADHAVHLLDGRARFVSIVTNFVENGGR